MSSQAQRSKQITVQESMTLMKNMLRCGVGCIAYARKLFPENCFRTAGSGKQMKFLSTGCGHKDASQLQKWLEKGVFDALTKGYLDTIAFKIHLQDGSIIEDCTVLESYEFKVTYPNDSKGGIVNLTSADSGSISSSKHTYTKTDVQKATISMLKKIRTVADTLPALPKERYLSMQLLYRDDITPINYEPTYFRKGDFDKIFDFPSEEDDLGQIRTNHHSIQVRVCKLEDDAEDLKNVNSEKMDSQQPGSDAESTLAQPSQGMNTRSHPKNRPCVVDPEYAETVPMSQNSIKISQFKEPVTSSNDFQEPLPRRLKMKEKKAKEASSSQKVKIKLTEDVFGSDMTDFQRPQRRPGGISPEDKEACYNIIRGILRESKSMLVSDTNLFQQVKGKCSPQVFNALLERLTKEKHLKILRGVHRGKYEIAAAACGDKRKNGMTRSGKMKRRRKLSHTGEPITSRGSSLTAPRLSFGYNPSLQ